MNIAQLNTIMIKNDANNRLKKGMRCYKENLVLDIKSIVDKEYESLDIYGKVMSESDIDVYNTNISFDLKNSTLIYTECSCEDFKKNCDFNSTYICKHIGASFYRFMEAVEDKIKLKKEEKYIVEKKNIEENVDYSEVLLKLLDDKNNNEKEKVNIQVNIERKEYRREKFYYEADFKIGVKKLYVVKSIFDFIEARKNKKSLEYGKEFIYNPDIHYFSEEDEELLSFVEEYVAFNETFQNEYQVYRVTNNTFGKGKTILISQSALKRFLSYFKNRTLTLNDGKEIKTVEVKKENLPIEFNVNEKNGDINITSNEDIPKALTYKGDVYLWEDKIYLPFEEQNKKI